MAPDSVPLVQDMDVQALGEALDARRIELGLSWKELAFQATERPNRRSERRIAPSTFQGLAKRKAGRDTVVLQALRWLGRTPESFVPGLPERAGEMVPDDDSGRPALDNPAIYLALDEKRAAEGLLWTDVADQLGPAFSAAKLKGLDGGPGYHFPQAMRICQWIGRPVAEFTCFIPD
jgi:hypothetical protein